MEIPDNQVLRCPKCDTYLAWMVGDYGGNLICTACHSTWYSIEHILIMLELSNIGEDYGMKNIQDLAKQVRKKYNLQGER